MSRTTEAEDVDHPKATPADQPDALHAAMDGRRGRGAVLREADEVTLEGHLAASFGVYGFEALREALRNPDLSPREYGEHMGLRRRYGPILIEMDDPAHHHHRAMLQPAFSRTAIDAIAASFAGPIDGLVGRLVRAGSGDLLHDLCEPFPALVLADLLGLAPEAAAALATQAPVHTPEGLDAAVRAADALFEDLVPTISARRGGQGGDLITLLANAAPDGRPLDDSEVFSHIRLLAIAGTDTAALATANLFFALLTHPDQLDLVRGRPDLVPAAVEEAVRWECPAMYVPRQALRDTSVGPLAVPAGSLVRCHLTAANRDPQRWTDPHRYDLTRERKQNAGFGVGAHACLGIHLARHLMARALTTVLAQLPGLELDPEAPPPEMAGAHVRAPSHLQVRWRAGSMSSPGADALTPPPPCETRSAHRGEGLMDATAVTTPEDLHHFVVRTPGAWTFAPIPAADPTEISVDEVVARLRSKLGHHEPRAQAPTPVLPDVAPHHIVAPVWMFVGLAAAGHLVVGGPDGSEALLDETDVYLLDALTDATTPSSLAATGHLGTLDEVQHRCALLIATGCARHLVVDAPPAAPEPASEATVADEEPPAPAAAGPTAPPEAPAPSGPATLRQRLADAYRLSSKLRPLREAIDRARGSKGT